MKNVIIIHSYNGDTKDSFAPSIEKTCRENDIDYYFPHFPTRSEATYEAWEKVLDEYRNRGILNEDSIIIAHSLGTQFIIKYLAKHNISIDTYISVAGFVDFKGREDLERILIPFAPTDEEFFKCAELINNRYSVYSDNDELNGVEKLEGYADKLSAERILIKGAGHFNPKSEITKIDEINNIITKIKHRYNK